jgi:replicative DNA helicase
LTVIAGQANIGKSIALGNLAMNAVQAGKKVVLISFDMDQDIYAARLDAAVANVNHNDLLHHRERIYDAVDDYRKKYNQVGKGNLVIKQFPTSTMTPAQLRSYLIRLRWLWWTI